MNSSCFVISFFLILSVPAKAWQGEPDFLASWRDSMHITLKPFTTGREKAAYLLKAVEKEQYTRTEYAYFLANEALLLAQSDGTQMQEGQAYFWRSWLHLQNRSEPYDEALADAIKSVELSRQSDDAYYKARALALKAALEFDISKDTDNAKIDLAEGLAAVSAIRKSYKDSLYALAYLYSVKANVEGNKVDLQQLSLKLFELVGDSVRVGRTCVKLCNYFLKKSSFDTAGIYIRRARLAYAQTPYTEGQEEALIKYFDYLIYRYAKTGDPTLFPEMLRLMPAGDTVAANNCELLSRLGVAYAQKAYFYVQQPALYKIYVDSARTLFREAWPLALATQKTATIRMIAGNLRNYCAMFGDCDIVGLQIADAYYELLQVKNRETTTAQHQQLQYYSRERASTLEQAKRQQENLLWRSLGIIGVIAAGFIFYIQRRNIHNMNREIKSRMEALRAQMNPHFISNTLNAIDSLVNHNRNKEASHYIIQFSRLCRIILNNSRSETISLTEELDMLRYFLNLEQLRLGEKLIYNIETDPILHTDQIYIPPMILQPFVENAIWHGIQPKNGPGTVSIRVAGINENLYECVIEDNGIGRAKSRELKKQMVLLQPSHGLAITEERLDTLQKLKGTSIQIEDLYNANREPAGTRVIITLPIQTKSPYESNHR